ncbi:FAD-binding oxidoreductase [Kushneria aurantia]|uniref:FAD-binding oxidoreductase n=1 Tax=Kushneria aurantia TaxID=504092 RepID=A0ABV6G558_9GAMM|nr:FAD-binding oxidoreductase [Kushneria aurantia]
MSTTTLTLRVVTMETLPAGVYRLFLRGDPQQVMFAPGQYLEIAVGEGWLPFSIANAPNGDGEIELHVQYVAGSASARALFDGLEVGRELTVRLPGGDSVLELDDPRPLLLIAAGTGFAQMKSIIEAALAHDAARPIHLWWAARERGELYLESMARDWQAQFAQFTFTPVVELPDEDDFDGVVERIDNALHDRVERADEASIFIAGSPGMVYAVVDTLERIEPLARRIFSDVFSYAPRAGGGTSA